MILFVSHCKGSLASCLCQCTYLLIFTYYLLIMTMFVHLTLLCSSNTFVFVCVSVYVSVISSTGELLRINMGALLVASLAC